MSAAFGACRDRQVAASVAVTPDGSKDYVVNANANNVSVIDTATNTVIGSPIPVGIFPMLLASLYSPRGDSPVYRG